MITNQCHNAACPLGTKAERVFVCSECRNVLYCSPECQTMHWKTHAQSCRVNGWRSIEATYVIKEGGGNSATIESPSYTGIFTTVLEKVKSLSGGTLVNNEFASDFFASMRINLKAILDTGVSMRDGNSIELDRMLSIWASTHATSGGSSSSASSGSISEDDTDNATTTRIERWRTTTTKSNYEKSNSDRDIELLIERKKIYDDLIAQCALQLGTRRSLWGKIPPAPVEGTIYLNLDWDDLDRVSLAWNTTSIIGKTTKGKMNPLFSSVEKARLDWLASLSTSLQSIGDMVGLEGIKEELGRFILNQIVFPISPVLSGNYINFIVGGNPGTGKTELAKKFPNLLYRLGVTPMPPNPSVVKITTRSDWIAEYEGQTATRTRNNLVKGLGSLIIMDEFYAFLLNDKDVYGYEFINQLVNDMTEYRGLLCIMAMGYYDRIEQGILKSNDGLARRFNLRWKIENYTGEELFLILFNRLAELGYELPKTDKLSYGGSVDDVKSGMQLLVKSFKAKKSKSTDIYDNYESIYNILVQLQGSGIFDNINAAVIPTLISSYHGIIVSSLVVDSKTGRFDDKYTALKKTNIKKLNLPVFIQTLVVYATQQGVTLIKL
jgi:hypothetical protein